MLTIKSRFMANTKRPAALAAMLALVPALMLFGSGCVSWKKFAYEGWGRDGWQQPARVIQDLDIKPGSRIADLGAGGGYFTFRLARKVRPRGRVLAVDVDTELLAYIKDRAQTENLRNISTVQARAQSSGLPAKGVDLIFTCNTYHHLSNRVAYLRHLRTRLSPKGRIAVLDLKPGFFRFGHATTAEVIHKEFKAAGFVRTNKFEYLSKQNFQVFRPQP